MTKIRSVIACTETGLHWDAHADSAICTDKSHDHRLFEVHLHLDTVVLPDGTALTAASFDPSDPYSRNAEPDYGLYLDSRWAPPWDHAHLDWPDFGLPADKGAVRQSLMGLLDRARRGQCVEVGCLGGHGRTGTSLACLVVLAGHPGDGAVNWVRANYCSDAVETPEQAAFAATFDRG